MPKDAEFGATGTMAMRSRFSPEEIAAKDEEEAYAAYLDNASKVGIAHGDRPDLQQRYVADFVGARRNARGGSMEQAIAEGNTRIRRESPEGQAAQVEQNLRNIPGGNVGPLRAVYAGVASGVQGMARAGGRLGAMIPGADVDAIESEIAEGVRSGDVGEAGRQIADLKDYGPKSSMNYVNKMISGATASITQAATLGPAAIGSFALDGYNRGYVDAKEKGLDEANAQRYAFREGAIEAAWATLFQKLGLGGLERQGAFSLKQGLREFVKQTGAEIGEEGLTEFSHALNEQMSGIDPEALSPEKLPGRLLDTAAQTLLAMGAQGAAAKGVSALVGKLTKDQQKPPEYSVYDESQEGKIVYEQPTDEEIVGTPGEQVNAPLIPLHRYSGTKMQDRDGFRGRVYKYETPQAEQDADRVAQERALADARDVESGMSLPRQGEFTYERAGEIPQGQDPQIDATVQGLGEYGDLKALPLDKQVDAVRATFGDTVPSKDQVASEFGVRREDARALIDLAYGEGSQPSQRQEPTRQQVLSRTQRAKELGVSRTQLPEAYRSAEGRAFTAPSAIGNVEAQSARPAEMPPEQPTSPIAKETSGTALPEAVPPKEGDVVKVAVGGEQVEATIVSPKAAKTAGKRAAKDGEIVVRIPGEGFRFVPSEDVYPVDRPMPNVVQSGKEIQNVAAAAEPAPAAERQTADFQPEAPPSGSGQAEASDAQGYTEQGHKTVTWVSDNYERLLDRFTKQARKRGLSQEAAEDVAVEKISKLLDPEQANKTRLEEAEKLLATSVTRGAIDVRRKAGRHGRIEADVQQIAAKSAPSAESEAMAREEARSQGATDEQIKDTVGFMGWNGSTGGLKPIAAWLRKWFTAPGNLPDSVQREKLIKDADVNAVAQKAKYAVADLSKAIKSTMPKATDADHAAMDDYLKGGNGDGLTAEVKQALTIMRGHVDAMSQQLVDSGAAEGKLIATIDKNKGVYLTRSYQAFDNPGWAQKVKREKPEVVKAAKAALSALDPSLSEAEIEGAINNLLIEDKAGEEPQAVLRRSKLGSKDLGQFIHRKDIPSWLRDLWGEYRDPFVNYQKTVMKTANIIANHRFQQEVRKAGQGVFFFDKPTGEYSVRIGSEDNPSMKPLLGDGPLYTTPEIKKAFEEVNAQDNTPAWLGALIYLNGAVKAGKTVFGGPTSILRNFTSNGGFMVANGHVRPDAFFATLKHLTNVAGDQAAWRAATEKYTRLGIIGDSVNMGDVRDAIDRYRQKFGGPRSQVEQGFGQRLVDFAQETYAFGDDVWKIYFFENEVRNYGEAYKGEWTQEQVERKAAEITRNTLPTYSLLPKGVKAFRRVPILGTFVAFPWEVYRTAAHTLSLVKEELANPKTRSMGARRLAGVTAAAAIPVALAAAAKAAIGMDDDDEEAARNFLPPWSKNNPIVWLSKEKGKGRYIDLGFQDPHSNMRSAVIAFMRGKTPKDAAMEAAKEVAGPFIDWNLTTKSILNALQNKDDTGKPIRNEEAGFDQQAKDTAKYMWKQFQPGAVTQALRIYDATKGEKNLSDELTALSGVRINTLDVNRSLFFRAIEYKNRMSKAKMLYSNPKNKGASGADLDSARKGAEDASKSVFDWMGTMLSSAQKLGMSKQEAIKTLREAGLPADDSLRAASGVYRSPIDDYDRYARKRK
jgi:hypothetical protein